MTRRLHHVEQPTDPRVVRRAHGPDFPVHAADVPLGFENRRVPLDLGLADDLQSVGLGVVRLPALDDRRELAVAEPPQHLVRPYARLRQQGISGYAGRQRVLLGPGRLEVRGAARGLQRPRQDLLEDRRHGPSWPVHAILVIIKAAAAQCSQMQRQVQRGKPCHLTKQAVGSLRSAREASPQECWLWLQSSSYGLCFNTRVFLGAGTEADTLVSSPVGPLGDLSETRGEACDASQILSAWSRKYKSALSLLFGGI